MKLSERLGRNEAEDGKRPAAGGFFGQADEVQPEGAELAALSESEPAERPRAARPVGPTGADLDELKARVRAAVVAELGPNLAKGAIDDQGLRDCVTRNLQDALAASAIGVGPSERAGVIDSIVADMLGWGPLEDLMADGTISEIMCNGFDEIWIERRGLIERTDAAFASRQAYRQVIDRMLATVGRRVDESSPMADGRLPDGSRINAIVPPLSTKAPVLTVRRFRQVPFTVTDLITHESISADAAVFLEAAVRGKLNVVISGGSGTGKTTLLNVLSAFIPVNERILTIEDAAELRLGQPHVVSLESRPANIEGQGQVTIRDLVRNALRMRPDRIVIGEVRGGEALDMLQAMNTGHEGSLTTVHANAPRDALARIETMTLMAGMDLPLRAVREQVASALDVIVQLDRRSDGKRVVSAITEVQGREGDTVILQDVFTRKGNLLSATGLRPKVLDKLAERDVTVPAKILRPIEGVQTQPVALDRRAR
ncbi:MAG: CpaF family protein [Actinomycetota bacterium]